MATNTPAVQHWADAPLAMVHTPNFESDNHDMWTMGSSHMCCVHNAIFRGFNSIYQQAPHIEDGDKASFIGYCRTWLKFLETHTEEEDSGLFAMTEQLLGEDVFQSLHGEHDAIDVILEEFRQYLVPLQSDPSKFSGPTLLEIMSRLRTPLESHFVSEVKMIASLKDHPSTPAAGSPQEAAETAKFERWGGNAIMKGGITDVVVFFLRNLDRTYEDGRWEHWPPIPAPVKWMLVNGVGLLHSGYWKFASCDANGRPQALYACK